MFEIIHHGRRPDGRKWLQPAGDGKARYWIFHGPAS
jgi:hypothetical protein